MELAAHHVTLLHHGGDGDAVLRRGHQTVGAALGVIGMNKIHTVAGLHVPQQRAFGHRLQSVPADVGDFQLFRDGSLHGHHPPGQQTQPLVAAVFETLLKEQLHAQADAQHRHALFRLLDHQLVQPGGPQLVRRVAEGAHAGQHQLVRLFQNSGVGAHLHLGPHTAQGGTEAEQVAHPVVNYADHHSTPFVDGISPANSGSMATAARRQRAAALKAPSMMWWELAPAIFCRCRVSWA